MTINVIEQQKITYRCRQPDEPAGTQAYLLGLTDQQKVSEVRLRLDIQTVCRLKQIEHRD